MLASARRGISYPNPDRSDRPDIPAHIGNVIAGLEVDVIYVQGTDADRLLAVHMAGVIWRATDTGLFWWDNGATWNQLGLVQGDVNKIGTNAARLANATLPAGTMWYVTDTGKAYRTDGLGNAESNWTLIAATAGALIDYAQITADPVAVVPTTEGTSTAMITGASVTYDGATPVKISFSFVGIDGATNNGTLTFVLYEDSNVIGQVGPINVRVGGGVISGSVYHSWVKTPGVGAHTYKVSAFASAASSFTPQAGAGGAGNQMPAWLRVERA